MKSLRNSVQLIGNLGNDPEVKEVANGTKMVRLSLATTENYHKANGEKASDTQWHNLVIWGKLADVAEKYLKKGKQIAVEGKLETNTYDDKDGQRKYFTQVRVNDLVMFGKDAS